MIRNFSVENYKNFAGNISLDLGHPSGFHYNQDCINNGIISKCLIYGKNGSGKTNLGRALMDLPRILNDNYTPTKTDDLNANAEEDVLSFHYEFLIDDYRIEYNYKRTSGGLLKEESFSINGKQIYYVDIYKLLVIKNYEYYNLSIGCSPETLKSLKSRFDRSIINTKSSPRNELFIPIPFLKWVIVNIPLSPDTIENKLFNYVDQMMMISGSERSRPISYGWFPIALLDKEVLTQFECFLKEMDLNLPLTVEELPDGTHGLYFKYNRMIPFFENASSGTLALADLFFHVIANGEKNTFVYLDEFDALYHYEMARNLIDYFKKEFPDVQLVITTHNTNLMSNRLLRPDCLLLLSKKGKLTPLDKATARELREGHNLEKMMISGEFEEFE